MLYPERVNISTMKKLKNLLSVLYPSITIILTSLEDYGKTCAQKMGILKYFQFTGVMVLLECILLVLLANRICLKKKLSN